MKVTKSLCLTAALLLSSGAMLAQNPAKYISWKGTPDVSFGQAYRTWQPGQPLFSNGAEDENFFIGRVKYRERFTNLQTQVDKALTGENDKNVFNWVPIGVANGGNPNALASGTFDSDVFSMWNYLTHYGNWTAPLVRMPGTFIDVVHKNGVATSVLASVPWGYRIDTSTGHGYDLSALYDGGAEKFIKLLKQYGIDGWGMNSEFNSSSTFAGKLQNFMADVYDKAITQKEWPQYAAAWYTLIDNSGSLSFADGLTNQNQSWFHYNGRPASNYVFGNYNWTPSKLATNDNLAKNLRRDPREIYAGMNLQGGEGRGWDHLKNSKTSIGLWGAHNMNMFFESRNEAGSSPEALQRTYLQRTEGFFSNGHRNPARKIEVKHGLGIGLDFVKNFHGVSALASAKSVLQWDLDQMPFYSFFNLGNGKFFNINGETARNAEWYNIAMQDYLPTWRYWFSKSYLGSNPADVEGLGLAATFSWEDAWFGGSSLEIKGTASSEYLHLFKTQFALKEGDIIRIRYKFNSGAASLSLAASAKDAESDEQTVTIVDADEIELGEWTTKEITVSAAGARSLRLAGKTIAAVALKFDEAKAMDLLIGEFSILRGAVQKPVKPIINMQYTKAYDYTYKGIDAKIIFDMPRPAGMPEGEHIYNEDVKTAYFKYYTQQEGGEEAFIGTTTSWAALCFSAPFDANGSKKIRFGVRAVGLDGVTEGDIAWSEYVAVGGSLVVSDEVRINKAIIKPNEKFIVSYLDSNHGAATWEILDNKTKNKVASFDDVKSFETSLGNIGLYDLKVTADGVSKTYAGLIQVSSDKVGATPEITEFTFNAQPVTGSEESEINKVNAMAYKGKKADGQASRGLNLRENPMTLYPSELMTSVSSTQSFTYAFWIKFNTLAEGATQFLNIRDPQDAWPRNNWGHVWTTYEPKSKLHMVTLRSSEGKDHYQQFFPLDITPGAWTHMAYVFEYVQSKGTMKVRFFVNGAEVIAAKHKREGKTEYNGPKQDGWNNVNALRSRDKILFGGSAHGRAGVDGVIDDVKFFAAALSESEISAQMYSEDANVNGLRGFWTFEDAPDAQNHFTSKTSNASRLAVGAFVAGVSEGESRFEARPASFEAGSPFISGTSFPVTTSAKWVFPRGVLTDASGSDLKGSANVMYKKTGVYTGKLILENSWGKDEREINMITIKDPGAVEDMTDEVSLTAFPNPFVERVSVRFAAAGEYQMAIYDLSGKLVSRQAVSTEAGGIVVANLNAPAGMYLMRVTTAEGKLLQTIKLQKK